MKLRGKAHKYGANVNTDVIYPARYLNIFEPQEIAKHCMEDIDSEFLIRVHSGDFVVGTTNFGLGSSREHAPIALKFAGISCVIASSFARIFFRNSINISLPLVECAEAAEAIDMGDEIEVDLVKGEIINLSKGQKFQAKRYPEFMLGLIEAGGLIEYTKQQLDSMRS